MSDNRSINVKASGSADFGKIVEGLEQVKRKGKEAKDEIGNLRDILKDLGPNTMRNLTTLVAGGISGGAMYGQMRGGLDRYKEHLILLDQEARSVKALSQAYREYHRSIIDAGRGYGFGNTETIQLASLLGGTYGRAGAGRLTGDMRTVQGLARGYGMGGVEMGRYFAQAERQGITSTVGGDVNPKQFAGLIADAIAAGRMQGREDEMITAILDMNRSINARTLTDSGTQLAANALATMSATGLRTMQGSEGAALLGQLNQGIMNPGQGEAGELFLYRALTGGQAGALNYGDFKYLQEEGLAGVGPTGKSNMQAFLESVSGLNMSDRYKAMTLGNLTGMSIHQAEGMLNTFIGPNGQFNMQKFTGLQDSLGGQAGMDATDTSVWALLAELKAGGNVGDIAREFGELSGQAPVSTSDRDKLFEQIKQYGQSGSVLLSEGQERQKLDADIADAAEGAASKLYDLDKAADQAALALIQIGGQAPGPLGGIAPIALGTLGGGLLGNLTGWAMGGLGRAGGGALGRLFPNLAGRIPGMGAPGTPAVPGGGPMGPPAAPGTPAAPAAGGGGMGWLGSALQFGGGLFAGSAMAGITSEATARNLGTGRLFDENMMAGLGGTGQLASAWMDAIGRGDYATATAISQASSQAMQDPAKAMGMSAIATPLALLGAYPRALMTGESGKDAYKNIYFGINQVDSPGRQQWQQEQQGAQNAKETATQIANINAALAGTGLEGRGQQIMGLSQQYKVPVPLALAMLRKESSLFSAGNISLGNNNPGNLRYTGNWGDIGEYKGFAVFPTLDAGLEGYFKLLGTRYRTELDSGDYASLVNRYAPPSENDSQLYYNQIMKYGMEYGQKIYGSRGGWWDVPRDEQPAMLHRGEMVLPQNLATGMRDVINMNMNQSQMRQGQELSVRVSVEPIVLRMPDGSTQMVAASGKYQPYDGVPSGPIGGFGR